MKSVGNNPVLPSVFKMGKVRQSVKGGLIMKSSTCKIMKLGSESLTSGGELEVWDV